jgi:hypothetical protein
VTSIRPTIATSGIGAALRSAVIPGIATTPPAPPPPPSAAPAPPPPPTNPLSSIFGTAGIQPPPSPLSPPAPTIPIPPPVAAAPDPASIPIRATINPAILAGLQPVFVPPIFTAPPPPQRTVTQVAQDAVAQLRGAARDVLSEAVRTLQAKSVAGKDVMSLLERRTRIGEVLSGSSTRWSAETVSDFAAAFQMDATRTATMDLIVALAVLNDPTVEAELRGENMPPATPQDFLQNRKIIYQYPPAGTELTPPYVVLVAVESQDSARADEVVNSILGQLVDFQGYRMPRDAAARLG